MTESYYTFKNGAFTAILSMTLMASGCSANQSSNEVNDNKSKLTAAAKQANATPIPAADSPIPISSMKRMNRQEQILFARENLAERLEIELDKVSLSGATPVIWRSGAMGCPKPEKQYTQALVKGMLIMLRVDNTPYRYHGIPSGEPFYCPDSQAEPPYTNSGDA